MDLRYGRGLHAFLGHFIFGVDPVPGLDLLALLGVDWDVTVQVLHSFFSVPV